MKHCDSLHGELGPPHLSPELTRHLSQRPCDALGSELGDFLPNSLGSLLITTRTLTSCHAEFTPRSCGLNQTRHMKVPSDTHAEADKAQQLRITRGPHRAESPKRCLHFNSTNVLVKLFKITTIKF